MLGGGTHIFCRSVNISMSCSTVNSGRIDSSSDSPPQTGQSGFFSCSKVKEYTPSVPISMK